MMTNRQFEIAMDILTSYYGMPQWDINPREGQDKNTIIKTWCDELGKYSTQQIQEACYWLTRKKRTMTFPSLPVLINELYGQQPEAAGENEPNRMYVMLMSNPTVQHRSEPIRRLISCRTIYQIYGVEVAGYSRARDTGYDNGTIPEYVRSEVI